MSKKDWKPHLDELERRRAAARAMGGPDRIERLMTQRGKLDAWQAAKAAQRAGERSEAEQRVANQRY